MGSSASKASNAASKATRKFPTQASAAVRNQAAPRPTAPASNPTPSPSPARPGDPGPNVYPKPSASETRDQTVNLDASDPVYGSRLRQLGAVQPNPFMSNSSQHPSDPRTTPSTPQQSSSTSASSQRPVEADIPSFAFQGPAPAMNPSLIILQARSDLQRQALREDQDVGSKGFAGRRFLDVTLLQQVLRERANGKSPADIEKRFGLKSGVIDQLGPKGLVDVL